MAKNTGNPNVIYIMADDLGYGDLSCYGAAKIRTPNIDEIALNGMRFTDAHSSAAVCTPSRYSVITGRYCWRSQLKKGVLGGFGPPLIETERVTIASMLREHGYHTAAIGKWHLGFHWITRKGDRLLTSDGMGWNLDGFNVDYSQPVKGGPTELGFDYSFNIAGSLDMPPYCFIENDRTLGIPDREKYPYNPQQRKGLMVKDWRDDQVDVAFTQKAVAFIDEHVKERPEQPFFLYLTPSAPHRPCVPPSFVRNKSRAGPRGDSVVLVDWMAGEILETLKRLNIRENTIIMVTSDNGATLTDYKGKDYGHKPNGDLRGGKADIWDGGHREPFIAMWPDRIKPGSECDKIVCLSDILATCAEIVGRELPDDTAEDSISILPLLLGHTQDRPVRNSIVHHSGDGMFSLRRGEWKYIEDVGSGGFSEPSRYLPGPGESRAQLYNIVNDSRENLNLWKTYPEIVDELERELNRIKESKNTRSFID
ncbi:MAG: arylsulfatase [Spirochaetes bacterium]|nr:arylsulfatase [Spirochaetota bacterium]